MEHTPEISLKNLINNDRRQALIEGIDLGVAPRDFGWDKDEIPPWWQRDGESDEWYLRFERFYLMQGPSRSIQSAYRLWVLSEGREIGTKGMKDVTNLWRERTAQFEWRKRASAYDGEINHLIAMKIEAGSRRLRSLVPNAVEALATSLTNPRQSVQAAKEILDRAGLPAVTRQEISAQVGITSEDIAAAKEEVDEWESKMLDESG